MTEHTSRRQVIASLIGATEAKIAELEADLAVERRLLERLQAERRDGSERQGPRKARSDGQASKIAAGTLTEKIAAFLRERGGKAMQASEITRGLHQQGVETTSKNGLLPMVLSSLSRRKDVFRKVARGRYRLIQREPKRETQETDEPAD